MNVYRVFNYGPKFEQRGTGKIKHVGIIAPTEAEARELAEELAPTNHFTLMRTVDDGILSMEKLGNIQRVPTGYYWNLDYAKSTDHSAVDFRKRKLEKILKALE